MSALSALGEALFYIVQAVNRPRTRADCVGGQRPCPWVSCRHHRMLRVSSRTGTMHAIGLRYGLAVVDDDDGWTTRAANEVASTEFSCVLDIADSGPLSTLETAVMLDRTRERVREAWNSGRVKVAAALSELGVDREALRALLRERADRTTTWEEILAENFPSD